MQMNGWAAMNLGKLNFKKLYRNRESQGSQSSQDLYTIQNGQTNHVSQAKKGKYIKQGSRGNILIFTAILMPLFILLIGLVTDIGRALVYKEELNKACMIAAQEACKKIDIDYAQSSGNSILDSSFEQDLFKYFEQNYKQKQNFILNYINYDIAGGTGNPKYLEVRCEGQVKCIFLKIIGIDNIKIHSQANGRLRSLARSRD
jgi:hypothetical protein